MRSPVCRRSASSRPPLPPCRSWLVAAAGVLVAAACASDVTLVEPVRDERQAITIQVLVEDTGLASSLGWKDGVPGALLTLRVDGSRALPVAYQADSAGRLVLTDLPAATYFITAERQLTGEESARAGGAQVLGGGAAAALERGKPLTIAVRPDRRGSLVISEYFYQPVGEIALNYFNSGYIELYNDSDATIYLDGMIIGSGFNYNLYSPLWTCEETTPMRIAEGGVWAQYLHVFPGSGRDTPVPPGGTVVIADQAIDHSALYPGLPDLSRADYEFGFADKADNPAVPNLREISLRPLSATPGVSRYRSSDVAFLAVPLDLATLRRTRPKYQGEFAFFPRETLIDLATFTSETLLENIWGIPMCTDGIVHPDLDPLFAWVPSRVGAYVLAVQRRLTRNGALMRTGTSGVDFELRPRSPGRVP